VGPTGRLQPRKIGVDRPTGSHILPPEVFGNAKPFRSARDGFFAAGLVKRGERSMASGKVKWFDTKKGFGFIQQDSGPDVFVHYTSISGAGFKNLEEGQPVEFELVDSPKGPKALNVVAK
jgi:CspA family cold shock protein